MSGAPLLQVPSRRVRSSLLALLAPLVFAAAGCATFRNTPEQNYVWEMGRICDGRVAFWKMDEVRADGSYTIRGATNAPPGRDDYFACMKEEVARQPYGRWLALHSRATAEGRQAPGASAILVPILLADKFVLVPVVLNQREGGTLLLDTGSVTILTPEAAKRAGIVTAADARRRSVYILGRRRLDVPFGAFSRSRSVARVWTMSKSGSIPWDLRVP